MNEKIQGIYEIQNTVNGKRYIGSSINIKTRWKQHKTTLKSGKSQSIKLQNAWNKYGGQSFKFNIVEIVNGSKEELYKREQYWMDFFDSVENGYNMCPAAGSVAGIKRSEKTKEKLSKAITGKIRSEETKRKISESKKLENLSEETRMRISEAQKGKKLSLETREKISNSGKGRIVSDETRKKLSERQIGEKNHIYGKHHTAESNARRSQALMGEKNHNYGKTFSEETRKKISESRKGEKNPNYGKAPSEETKAKRAATRNRHREERLLKTTT